MEKGKIRDRHHGAQMPDCTTCIHRKEGCERAEENSFCTRYASRNPEIRNPDPNEQWLRGEDADL